MVITRAKQSALFFLLALSFIFIVDFTLVRTVLSVSEDQLLAYAVLIDFVLVIPFLYWFCIVRKTNKSISRVFALPLLGAITIWFIFPGTVRETVWNVIWPIELLIVLCEVVFIGYELRVLYRLVCRFRLVTQVESDTTEAMRITVKEEIGDGKLASILLHDICMIYYLLFSWKRKPNNDTNQLFFSYHRNTGQLLNTMVITKFIIFEGIAIHLLIQNFWYEWIAWILTFADLWFLALIWADWRASLLKQVKLEAEMIRLRYGLRIQADLPLHAIARVERIGQNIPDSEDQQEVVTPLLTFSNVLIECKHPVTVQSILFLPRRVKKIFLSLDEPETFVKLVNQLISKENECLYP